MMSEYKEKENAIRKILMNEWDPIGVVDEPKAQNEYDSYIPMIYKFSIVKKSKIETFDFLLKIETDFMGFTGDSPIRNKEIMEVAEKLIKL